MLTLTKAAVTTRKSIRYGIYAVVAILVLRLLLSSFVAVYKKVFPPKAPPPTVKYGVLPRLPFPTQENPSFSYELEFLKDVKKMPTQAKVYYIPKPQTDILALEKAKEKAKNLGFDPDGRELVETVYSFSSLDLFSTLNINIVTNAFSVTYDLSSNPSVLDLRAPDFVTATGLTRSLLQKSGLLSQDLTEGPTLNQYLKRSAAGLVEAVSLSDANATKINLFRMPYDEIPAVTEKSNESNVWFVIASPANIIAAEYNHFDIDSTEFATYPIKTLEQAWEDLVNSEAYIASHNPNSGNQILITNVYLAYFDPSQYTEFYQPVIVFEDEEGFRAYVPAVLDEYYEAKSAE